MRRTQFASKAPTRREAKQYAGSSPSTPRKPAPRVVDTGAQIVVSIPKVEPVRSEAYRRLVAAMPCIACGLGGSNAAHPNSGKGTGTKTDDRECFPLCADSPGRRGCHPTFDQGAMFSKAARRAIEPAWSADTRRRIIAAGAWPAKLPMWQESSE